MFWLVPIIPLFVLAFLPFPYDVDRVVSPAVTLQEGRQVRFKTEVWMGTPVTPVWKELLERSKKAGWKGKTNGPRSGIRSYAQQERFYRLWRKGRGAPAFPPNGPSRHLGRNIARWGQWSQAVDVSRPKELIRIAGSLGAPLYAPYPPEPWHIQARHVFSLPEEKRETVEEKTILPPLTSLSLVLILSGAALWSYGRKTKRIREDFGSSG